MSGPARGIRAGLTFLCGFALVVWLAGGAAGSLRGPRAELMRELDALRRVAGVGALRGDGTLAAIANQQAKALARGSVLARARTSLDLERSARGRGWRGGPLLELRLAPAAAGTALRERLPAEPDLAALVDATRTQVGIGIAAADHGSQQIVVLLAAAAAMPRAPLSGAPVCEGEASAASAR